jgi:hypothetical protein
MTPTEPWGADPRAVRLALVNLYGAVAAVVRGDTDGARLLLDDLEHCGADLTELLAAISIASLERLGVALSAPGSGHGRDETSHGRIDLATRLVRDARDYRVASPRAVHEAAWRLDAVRRGDRLQAVRDVESATATSTPTELLFGATALLAAIVALWARNSGQSTRRAATDLCLAASFDHATA